MTNDWSPKRLPLFFDYKKLVILLNVLEQPQLAVAKDGYDKNHSMP
jgi:hypothetical protein